MQRENKRSFNIHHKVLCFILKCLCTWTLSLFLERKPDPVPTDSDPWLDRCYGCGQDRAIHRVFKYNDIFLYDVTISFMSMLRYNYTRGAASLSLLSTFVSTLRYSASPPPPSLHLQATTRRPRQLSQRSCSANRKHLKMIILVLQRYSKMSLTP